jgi:cephalosporin hydroxylase
VSTQLNPLDSVLINKMAHDGVVDEMQTAFWSRTAPYRYTYNFSWLGIPIIQIPQDIYAMQEIIWRTRPDAILETGIAHGGSLILSASMLELLGGERFVVGIDVDIRKHNKKRLESHPMFKKLRLVEGSSTDISIFEHVKTLLQGVDNVMVVLDSLHTQAHVLKELALYSPLVKKGGYLVVCDTCIECLPAGYFTDRPWDKGNNPMTAVEEFLRTNHRFEIDEELSNKLIFSSNFRGYLRCIQD